MVDDLIQILILLGIIIFVKKFGFTVIGLRKLIKGYIDVTENPNRKIVLTVKRKIFGIFDKNKAYELKYIKVKNNIKEVKEYFDIVLKDKEYILREVESNKFFDFKKKAVIYLRDTLPVFDRLSTRFLPETELKSIIREMVELNIVEIEKEDFKTLTEKMSYANLIRKLNKSKEKK
jgi:hypothetical protein